MPNYGTNRKTLLHYSHRSHRSVAGHPLAPPRQHRYPTNAYSAKRMPNSTTSLRGYQDSEEDPFNSGLQLRTVSVRAVRAWMVFQMAGFVVHWGLWSEVTGHLDTYDAVLAAQCPPERQQHGVCLGPMWNLSTWQDVFLESAGRPIVKERDIHHPHSHNLSQHVHIREHLIREAMKENATYTFDFVTLSRPPTFLLVVDPIQRTRNGSNISTADASVLDMPEFESLHWAMSATRTSPPQLTSKFTHRGQGQAALTFVDLSTEADQQMRGVWPTAGFIRWRINLTSYSHSVNKTRFIAFVEDSAVPQSHLLSIHSNAHCSFARSWKSFNMQRQGRRHEMLSQCRWILGAVMPFAAAFCFFVYWCFLNRQRAAEDNEHQQNAHHGCFHCTVLAKFFIVDVPLQICLVLYLLGWYETDGLKCQLCLFHIDRCEEEHPFRMINSAAVLFVLLSCVSNQLLVHPADLRKRTEEDICWQYSLRIGALCVFTLPFTTGTYWATNALISTPVFAQVLFFFPCCIGWFAVAAMSALFVCKCCQDCDR